MKQEIEREYLVIFW